MGSGSSGYRKKKMHSTGAETQQSKRLRLLTLCIQIQTSKEHGGQSTKIHSFLSRGRLDKDEIGFGIA